MPNTDTEINSTRILLFGQKGEIGNTGIKG